MLNCFQKLKFNKKNVIRNLKNIFFYVSEDYK